MASIFRPSPQRPTIEIPPKSPEPESGREESLMDEDETVETVMNKLGIERRVQYGAEKMLDVIEQRSGAENHEMKERITAQLEAAANRIRDLENQLERLRGVTPLRSRMRPQARLHGFSSNSSLSVGQMSSSVSSSTLLSATRPHISRQASRLTPDREKPDVFPALIPLPTTPSRAGSSGLMPNSSHSRRPRSTSTGADSLGSPRQTETAGSSRMGWMPSTSPGDIAEEGHSAGMIENAVATITRLRALGSRPAGKGKEVDRGDEAWQCMTKLAGMLKKAPSARVLLSAEEIIDGAFAFLSDASTARRRAAAYRLLRHILERQSWGSMLEAGIEWLIVRTFTRDAKCVHEREQALRLIRAVVTLPNPPPPSRPASRRRRSSHSRPRSSHSRQASAKEPINVFTDIIAQRVPLTDGIMRSVVSVAENQDDALRTICMQTLIEIGLVDIERLMQTDAFRIVLLVYKDGPTELGPSVSALLAFLSNFPHTRHRLVPGADLESALVGFTEDQAKPSARQPGKQLEQFQANVKNITILLNTWSGLLYLCMDGRRAITALISSLLVPNDEIRDALLNLLFSIFKIKLPAWKDAFLDGKRLTVYNRAQEAISSTLNEETGEAETPDSLNLIDQYVALLMATFIESGLLEALVALIGENINALNRKATLLLGEMLQKANRILPLQYAAQIQALPTLFAESMDFKNPIKRSSALSALSSIGSLTRNHKRVISSLITRQSSTNHSLDPLGRGQIQLQQAKLRQGLQLDDRQFIQMINDSGVILNRDHTKWNYDLLVDLLEGALMNPKRLDEAIKATKFVRRLMSFFHPTSGRFSSINRTRPNQKWVKLGCILIKTLLSNPEGVRYLAEDKLLSQMADCFHDIDERSGKPSSRPVFAKDRVDRTLAHGYFEMFGTLTKHREGMVLVDKYKFFNALYHLTEQPTREQIVRYAIECFDYTLDGHPRLILSKALTTCSLATRLFATHQLGRILHDQSELDDWALQLMITQLYDTAIEICDIAVMYLEEVCTDQAKLEKVVAMRPALEHLGDIGHPLFMRFVSTSIGFEYLLEAQYIEREMEIWLTEKNLLYVIEVETWVSQTLRPFTSDTVEDYWTYDGTAPSHFFGELTKTPEGCQFLREQGVVGPLAEIVRLHGLEARDDSILTTLKCALWALGNIGSTDGGLPFLEDEEVVEAIVEIAEQSPVLSIRGTAFFVIGLLSAGRRGAELLEEFGWMATRTSMGATTGLCLPTNLDRFTRIQPWKRSDTTLHSLPLPKLSGLEGEIMTSISNLSNYVLASSAMNNLKRIRNRHARYFSSITLFHRALRIVSTNHYPAPVRRFILEMFEIQINPETLVQLRHIELSSFTHPAQMGHLREHADEHQVNLNNDPDHEHDYAYDAGHEDDYHKYTGREHRRRSASNPGPQRPAAARKRGLTISDIPNSAGESSHDEPEMGDGVRHLPREKIAGFGNDPQRSSVSIASSRASSRPMSRRTSQASSKLLDFDPRRESLA